MLNPTQMALEMLIWWSLQFCIAPDMNCTESPLVACVVYMMVVVRLVAACLRLSILVASLRKRPRIHQDQTGSNPYRSTTPPSAPAHQQHPRASSGEV